MEDFIDNPENGKCLYCGNAVHGRKDKKFCNLQCKNRYHNQEVKRYKQACRQYLESLQANYSILDSINRSGRRSASLKELEMAGFRREMVSGHRIGEHRHHEFLCLDFIYCQSDTKIFNLRRVDINTRTPCPSPDPSTRQ